MPSRINLGDVQIQKPVEVVFTREDDSVAIRRVDASCGCTSPHWHPYGKEIRADFVINAFPEGPKSVGESSYETEKYITVEFEDGTFDLLLFDARVHNA